MKAFAAILTLLLALTTGSRAADDITFLATLTGGVAVQETVAVSEVRIRTVPLTNASVCTAFGVSTHDHVVGVTTNANGFTTLALYSKSAAGPAPIVIFTFTSFTTLIEDSKLNTARFQTAVANNTGSGLFSGFTANVLGNFKYNVSNGVFTPAKVVLTVSGNGTDTNGGTTGNSALINFKVTSGKKFVQGP